MFYVRAHKVVLGFDYNVNVVKGYISENRCKNTKFWGGNSKIKPRIYEILICTNILICVGNTGYLATDYPNTLICAGNTCYLPRIARMYTNSGCTFNGYVDTSP